MRLRRRRGPEPEPEQTGPDAPAETDPGPETAEPGPEADRADPRAEGPWDRDEVEVSEGDTDRVDLGGLLLPVTDGLEMQVQVDRDTQQIASVALMGEEGACELRPLAAPRNSDIWDDVREELAEQLRRQGGSVTEADGRFGRELRVVLSAPDQQGQRTRQASRLMGIRGPRWLLRATYLGRPAVEPHEAGLVESTLRRVVVVRGEEAMAPGDPIPLRLPSDAQPMSPPQ